MNTQQCAVRLPDLEFSRTALHCRIGRRYPVAGHDQPARAPVVEADCTGGEALLLTVGLLLPLALAAAAAYHLVAA